MLIRMLVFRAAVVVPFFIWGEVWMQIAAATLGRLVIHRSGESVPWC